MFISGLGWIKFGPPSFRPIKSAMWGLVLLGAVFATQSGHPNAEPCPSQCRCTRGRVYCNNRGFTEIPQGIPPGTKILYLQDNELENSDQLDRTLSRLTQERFKTRSEDIIIYKGGGPNWNRSNWDKILFIGALLNIQQKRSNWDKINKPPKVLLVVFYSLSSSQRI